MESRRAIENEFFFVRKARPGRYRACVDLAPGMNGLYRYCRDAPTREEAEKLLEDLRRLLQENAGPVLPIIEAWRNGREVEGGGLENR